MGTSTVDSQVSVNRFSVVYDIPVKIKKFSKILLLLIKKTINIQWK